MFYNKKMNSKPFLKWAGGKSQLLNEIEKYFPPEIFEGRIYKYFEPFVGGGAVFFHISNNFSINESFICDINQELILTYKIIRDFIDDLIEQLEILQIKFIDLSSEDRKLYYYHLRKIFNENIENIDFEKINSKSINRAAQTIFLNHTCYNGLFRVNQAGEFNVPYGCYKNPKILDKTNLLNVSLSLQNTRIELGDFSTFTDLIDKNSFVYFDPPYIPISKSANFTSYSSKSFNRLDQLRLAKYSQFLNSIGTKVMLSNSDPTNIKVYQNNLFNDFDTFFENEFIRYGFNIKKVKARRNINCDGNLRGKISELIIINY